MSSLLIPIFNIKNLTRIKKVYQKTRAFLQNKIICGTLVKKVFFLGAEEKIKKNNGNLNE